MSELINNREQPKPEKVAALKNIIKLLHEGKSVEEVKVLFNEQIGSVSVEEISQMEQALMNEEGIPVSEIQRLCSVHAAVVGTSIETIHQATQPEFQAGHPIHTFKIENQEIDKLVNIKLAIHTDRLEKEKSEENIFKVVSDLNLLYDVDKHYSRKENLLFPYLEKYGIYGPTKVMWGVDDKIRDNIKEAKRQLIQPSISWETIIDILRFIIKETTEMIFKEENILFPMALSHLTEDEWVKIAEESEEVGYCLIEPKGNWVPKRDHIETNSVEKGFIKFDTGIVTVKQLQLTLRHLPIDLTFIDDKDIVRFFSHGTDPIFVRTKAIIGRTVLNCHPPKSAHIIEKLLEDFKSGAKDNEDFWIPMGEKFVYIRYFAVRDEEGKYVGTVEFTQNIAPIQQITGQKRIMT
ncbi:MAG: hypothetical protein K0R71_739 [Bacillales bacterium]|jgi:DUF438 domain-containing protein|nr:hypothetical protein [Bacillales bacterium]